MPERAAYDEAMLLSQDRLKVQDQDLKQGHVETITIPNIAGLPTFARGMKRPWGIQGGFAVVYKFTTQSGKTRALRCFLIKMDPDIGFRYKRIGAYFVAHVPDITVNFNYYDSGIILKETVQIQHKSYPLIDMEWIEGPRLIDYVDELCQKSDTTRLAEVIDQWCGMMATLQKASISHGSLNGLDIMVRPNGHLVLVDYDGVYIPDFAGMQPIVLGYVDYQHPEMTLRPFNERTDDFSAWVIYTALLALQLQPGLWQKYIHHNAQGMLIDTNLLFRKDDFLDPDHSSLFAELSRIRDTRLDKAVYILKQACKQPVTNVPMFVPPDPDAEKKQVLTKLPIPPTISKPVAVQPMRQFHNPELTQPSTASNKTMKIFYCYAHEDKVLHEELEKHLQPLKNQRKITSWHDRNISAGKDWEKEININLNTADIILLLISADFMVSNYCYGIEMKRALERHHNNDARVIPIILRDCDWEDEKFSQLQVLPTGGKAVNSWLNRDEAFADIARGIKKVVVEMLEARQ